MVHGSRIARVAAPAFVVLAVIAGIPTRTSAQTPVVERLGEIPAVAPAFSGQNLAGSMVIDATRRRAYQVRETREEGGSSLVVYDLDSLDRIAEIILPRVVAPGGSVEPMIAVDEEHGRLFIGYVRGPGDRGLIGIMVVDEATGQVTDQPMPPTLDTLNLRVGGMSYSAMEKRLYLLVRQFPRSDPESQVNQTVLSGLGTPRIFILRWDPATGQQDVLRFLRSCRALYPSENPTGHYMLPVFRSLTEPAVWVGCSNNQGGFLVVRVAADQLSDPAGPEDVFPGPERIRDALYDPSTDRIVARYSAALGESWWVFDGRRRSWVGVIGASNSKDRADYAAGLDPASGRLYLHYPGVGLLLADARQTPVPQALVFPQFPKDDSPQRIVIDPNTRRFFIRTRTTPPDLSANQTAADVETPALNRYDVLRDQPPAPEPPPPNPDANTSDVPEEEGKTSISFTGISQGYGARALLVGGVFGVVPPGPGAEDARPLRALMNRTGTQCGPRDREIVVGLVEKAELGNSVAAVRAQAAKTDEATNQDLMGPSRCDMHPDPGPPFGPGLYPGLPGETAQQIDGAAQESLAWEGFFATSECSGDEQPDEGSSREPLEEMRVSVRCAQSDSEAEAQAGGPAIETPAARVGTALSRTKLFRDRRRGIVSQVYSVARGIEIGDPDGDGPAQALVTIDAVETWAEAWANGREKKASRDDTAATRFVRRITGVEVRDEDGRLIFACEHCSRDLLPAVQQMNAVLTGRAEVRLPMPDPVLLTGTPGGFQAAVQKDRFQSIADNALNNDASREIPGLEIVSINDSPELRARQVIQLAGVAAGSSYGIFLLERFDFSGVPALPDATALPAGAEVESDPVSGTTVSEIETGPPPRLDDPSLGESVSQAVGAVARGASYLIRNPVEGMLATVVWLTLALPVYAFVRRRSLLRTLDDGSEG